jgi:hypothetical protein
MREAHGALILKPMPQHPCAHLKDAYVTLNPNLEASVKATLYSGTPQEVSLEGNPAEIAEVLRGLGPTQEAAVRATTSSMVPNRPADPVRQRNEEYVSVTIARQVLTRIPLPDVVLKTVRTLYRRHPELVSARELGADISYSSSQFGGLLGAFGRRVSHTPGYEAGASFFIQEWDASEGCWRYGLPESVREALRLVRLT